MAPTARGGAVSMPSASAARVSHLPSRLPSPLAVSSSSSSSSSFFFPRNALGAAGTDDPIMMEHDSQEIRVCALVLSVLAFFLFIAAEIVSRERSLVHILVALGTLGFAWTGPLTLLAGTIKSSKFKWWQPFQGGTEFVWMQAFGWSLHTLVLTGAVVILANNNRKEGKWMEGQYLMLGISGFVAQLLLNLSIGTFKEEDVEDLDLDGDERDDVRDANKKTNKINKKRFPWNAKAIVSMLISGSGALLFVLFDLYADRLQSNVVILVGSTEFLLSALMIHVFYGAKEIPGYKLWQPFEGERVFLLLQYLGWQFLAGMLVGTMMLCVATDFSVSPSVSRGAPTMVGAMGLISQIILLLSLHHFAPSTTTAHSKESSEDSATTTHRSTVETRRRPGEVYVSGLLCTGAVIVGCVSYAARFESTSWRAMYLVHEKIFWTVSMVAIGLATPIAHVGAVRAVPEYNWWQPFIGGTKFVFLQTLGWLWYGVFVASSLLLGLNDDKFAETAAPCALFIGCLAAAALITSLPFFCLSTATMTTTVATSSLTVMGGEMATQGNKKSGQLMLHHGEIAISLLMTLSSVICHVLADHVRVEDDDNQSQVDQKASHRILALVMSALLFVSGCFVSHSSGRRLYENYQFFQPFEGGAQFVVWQAVGWTLVAVQLLFDTLVVSVPARCLPFGVISCVGMFALVPHLAIITSLRHFRPSSFSFSVSMGGQGSPTLRGGGSLASPALSPLGSPRQIRSRTKPPRRNMKSWTLLLQRPDLQWLLRVIGVVTLGALLLFAAAHACHHNTRYRHADEVLYGFGFVVAAGGILFTHVGLGPRVQPGYQSFQPFEGGLQFVTLQGVAWTLAAVAWIAACTALYWRQVFFQFQAIHALTALMFLTAQCMMLYSLPLFTPPEKEEISPSSRGSSSVHPFTSTSSSSSASSGRPEMLRKLERITHEFFVGPVLGMAACVVFVLVDISMLYWGPVIPVFPVTVCAVLALFSAIPMSYKFAKSTMGLHAKALGGSVVFLVLGSALWSFTILLGALFCSHVWGMEGELPLDAMVGHDQVGGAEAGGGMQAVMSASSTSSSFSSSFMGTCTGTVGFVAQLVFFQACEAKKRQLRAVDAVGMVTPTHGASSSSRSSRAASARAAARRARDHLLSASIWFYSSAAVATGFVYAYTMSLKTSRQLPTQQVVWMALCSLGVIGCAYFIQRHILFSSSSLPSAIPSPSSSKGSHHDGHHESFCFSENALVLLESDVFANLAAFLTVAELLRLSSTCRSIHHTTQQDDTFWWRQFTSRVGGGVGSYPKPPHKTAIFDPVTMLKEPFAFKWMTRFEDHVLNAVCRLQLPHEWIPPVDKHELAVRHHRPRRHLNRDRSRHSPTPLSPQPWKLMCISYELHGSCDKCALCGKMEMVSERNRQWESGHACALRVPSTWVRLCHCVDPMTLGFRVAHRACLEKQQQQQVGACPHCQQAPQPSQRYPHTLRELCGLTWTDFRSGREDFAGGFFSFVPMAVSLVVLSARSFQLGCFSLYVWICFAMALCFVSNTPRISQSLEQIGGDETSRQYVVYQRLVHALTLPSLVHVFWGLGSAPLGVLDVLLAINYALLLTFAMALLLLFWRSNYRVATFASCLPPPTLEPSTTSATSATTMTTTQLGNTDIATTTTTTATTLATATNHNVHDHSCVACLLALCSFEPQTA